jgi:hypothetical protein
MRRRQQSEKEELRALWERNRKARERVHHSFVRIKKAAGAWVAEHQPAERPEHLRADDFVRELARLGGVWWDERFLNCVQALFDHGIVEQIEDERFRFTGKKEPNKQQIADHKDQDDRDCVAQIRALVEQGESARSASEKVAAATGYPGESHSAASDRLRMLYRENRSRAFWSWLCALGLPNS